MIVAPLEHIVQINSRTLPEWTDPRLEFSYLDIGAVGRGTLLEDPVVVSFGQAPSRARRIARAGDTVISTVRTYLRAVWHVPIHTTDLVVSTGFAVLSPGVAIESRYLGWLAQSDIVVEEVVARSVGVSYPAINASDIGKIQVPVPTLSNQARIADFLDAETSRIDALIAKKRRLVALIEERWSTVVAAAVESVDGGGGAPMLRRYLESVVGGSWGAEPGQGMIDARCIRGTDFDFRTLGTNSASAPTRSFNTEEFGARRLGENDLVIEKSGGSEAQPVGRVVRWTGKEPAVPTNFAARIRPSEVVSSKYLAYVFLSAYHAGLTRSWAKQTTGIQNLDIEGLLSEHRALPDVGAQEKAAARLDRYTERVRYVQDRINKQVVTLRERRGALITAAVTGELEIPGTAA